MIQIAILGLGTVGTGVAKVVAENARQIERKLGEPLQVKTVLVRHFKDGPYRQLMTDDFKKIEEDDGIRVVVETIGGVEAAYEYTKRALNAGKHVVTANKQLVAERGCELLSLARKKGVSYLFEASVGGGIPVLHPLTQCMAANRIDEVYGILNGTTNYILTKMEKEGADYGDVLKKAQELGYAERNPEADVEGHDACRKIAILASLVTGKNVDSEKIFTEGITKLDIADFKFADAAGMKIKLLAICRSMEDGGVLAMVAPFMIPKDSPLAMVNDVFNGVLVTGNMLGDALFYGRGAGKLPTASAVVADVIDCARHPGKTVVCIWDKEEARLTDAAEMQRRFFVRAKAETAADVEAAFPGGECFAVPEYPGESGYFTPVMKEKEFLMRYQGLGDKVLGRIRLV